MQAMQTMQTMHTMQGLRLGDAEGDSAEVFEQGAGDDEGADDHK